ncbi:MAG: hypothetical protein HC786_17980, partial [Richelia sp. CSU_2_1]|nr:hypothetical protein [Richelia sp. CSU_2_1]
DAALLEVGRDLDQGLAQAFWAARTSVSVTLVLAVTWPLAMAAEPNRVMAAAAAIQVAVRVISAILRVGAASPRFMKNVVTADHERAHAAR